MLSPESVSNICKIRKRASLGAARISLSGHRPHYSNQEGGGFTSRLEWPVVYAEPLDGCNGSRRALRWLYRGMKVSLAACCWLWHSCSASVFSLLFENGGCLGAGWIISHYRARSCLKGRKWNATALLNKMAKARVICGAEKERHTKKVSVEGVKHRMICIKCSALFHNGK
jgi:hypothetical protein